MNKMLVLGITLIILLIPFFLISIGTTGESPGLWWTGLILLGLGGLVPPISRYTFDDES